MARHAVAIITARGGSKRIPKKNIRSFAGKPVIEYPITMCLDSGLFERVFVSTDDLEIAAIARNAGAEVPFVRPAQLSDDHATTIEVMAHAVNELGLSYATQVCCIYPVTPLLDGRLLDSGRELLDSGRFDYVFCASALDVCVQRSFSWSQESGLELFFPAEVATRTQDLPIAYSDLGQFYWAAASTWSAGRPILGPRSGVVVVQPGELVDVDTEGDWHRAEQLWLTRRAN
jgi:pseudaminic acid cytidylyltransferase